MAAKKYPSPCCNAKSLVRRISLAEKVLVLRCTACARLRLEALARPKKPAPPRPAHLKLIVSR